VQPDAALADERHGLTERFNHETASQAKEATRCAYIRRHQVAPKPIAAGVPRPAISDEKFIQADAASLGPYHQLIAVTSVWVVVRVAIAVIIFAAVSIKASTKATALETTVVETAVAETTVVETAVAETTVVETAVAETAVAHREPAASETATAKAVTSAAKTTAMPSAAKTTAVASTSAATTASPCERGCAGCRCRYAEHDGSSCCNHLLAHFSKLLMFHSI
jgi:hypothetical protein